MNILESSLLFLIEGIFSQDLNDRILNYGNLFSNFVSKVATYIILMYKMNVFVFNDRFRGSL